MIKLQWLRYDMRQPILLIAELQSNTYDKLKSLCRALVSGMIEAYHVPPRGREIMLWCDESLGEINEQATKKAGIKVYGNVVLLDPDVWRMISDT